MPRSNTRAPAGSSRSTKSPDSSSAKTQPQPGLARGGWPAIDLDDCIGNRHGNARLFAMLEEYLAERDLSRIDHDVSAAFVSNPRSGELVKGHAIVLAELGLCPYRGQIVRSPDVFAGAWSKVRRAEHLLARLALVRELFAQLARPWVTLYRGMSVSSVPRPRPIGSLVSATFSQAVAEAHFDGGPDRRTSLLWRGPVEIDRLLMTFLETPALNAPFREAEAILISRGDVM